MCLTVDPDLSSPTKPITIYKLVIAKPGFFGPKYYSQPREIRIKLNRWYKAKGKIVKTHQTNYLERMDYTLIEGGVIHAYTDIFWFINHNQIIPYNLDQFLKCKGYPEDFVAYGDNNDVCFKKIFVEKVLTIDDFNNS